MFELPDTVEADALEASLSDREGGHNRGHHLREAAPGGALGGEPYGEGQAVRVDESSSDESLSESDLDELTEVAVQLACMECAVRLEMVRKVAVLDRGGIWRADGQTCLANWVALRFGIRLRTAREIAGVSRRIENLPRLAEAFGQGRLSWDQLVPLCQLATAESDEALAEEGPQWSPEDLARMAARKRMTNDRAKSVREQRSLTFRPHHSGGTEVRGLLDNADAEAVRVALDRISSEEAVKDPATGCYPSGCQQRADALVSLAHRGLGADTNPDLATVVFHADAAVALDPDCEECGHLADGTPVAAETIRRHACDSRIEWAYHDADGVVLGVGRATRSWPYWLARQIRERDGNRCRFPGCPNHAVHIHHIQEVNAQGPTNSRNGVCLCFVHHPSMHEGGWSCTGNADSDLTFTSPTGRVLPTSCARRLDPEIRQHIHDLDPSLWDDES
jgi:hypothetical protein